MLLTPSWFPDGCPRRSGDERATCPWLHLLVLQVSVLLWQQAAEVQAVKGVAARLTSSSKNLCCLHTGIEVLCVP